LQSAEPQTNGLTARVSDADEIASTVAAMARDIASFIQ
jgi:hypothetical protein